MSFLTAHAQRLHFANAEITLMREHDLDHIVELERRSNPFPWTREHFESALRGGYLCLVARDDSAIIGFAITRMLVDDAELLLIAVHPNHRRGGNASALLDAVLSRLKDSGKTPLHLEVRESNVTAITFYEARGFARSGLRKHYYPNGTLGNQREHALLMQRVV
jgi:[ribosomal protein S18]-alanine N-acetyltransferase